MRRPALFVGMLVVGVSVVVSSCEHDEDGSGSAPRFSTAGRTRSARSPLRGVTPPYAGRDMVTAVPQPTRAISVDVAWTAPAGAAGEAYSEARFPPLDLRYGERFVVQRVCVSDPRKITMISYTDTVGHTDVPLMLGNRGAGRPDPDDSRCTVFDGVEIARVEKCKCWFQCASERHTCSVSGFARRD